MLCNYAFHHIKISSHGLMIKHEQFGEDHIKFTFIFLQVMRVNFFFIAKHFSYNVENCPIETQTWDPSPSYALPFFLNVECSTT